MEPAVSMALADVLWQLTAWDGMKTGELRGFIPRSQTASQAATGPHSRRNPWPLQCGKIYQFNYLKN